MKLATGFCNSLLSSVEQRKEPSKNVNNSDNKQRPLSHKHSFHSTFSLDWLLDNCGDESQLIGILFYMLFLSADNALLSPLQRKGTIRRIKIIF